MNTTQAQECSEHALECSAHAHACALFFVFVSFFFYLPPRKDTNTKRRAHACACSLHSSACMVFMVICTIHTRQPSDEQSVAPNHRALSQLDSHCHSGSVFSVHRASVSTFEHNVHLVKCCKTVVPPAQTRRR